MNTKILMALVIMIAMITVTAARPTVEHVEGNYTYDGSNENLEVEADWDYTVTHQTYYDAYRGEANAHVEYTYLNDGDHTEFVGGNAHIEGYARIANNNHPYRAGQIKVANIYTDGNVYTGYENVEHFDAVSYYDEETGHRVTVSAYDVVERYENGYEFEGYLKIRQYRVRPASYFTWTPYEQHTWDEMGKYTDCKVRSRDSLETGIVAYIGLPVGTVVESYIRTSTANSGAGIPMTVIVPGYIVGSAPWDTDNTVRKHNALANR